MSEYENIRVSKLVLKGDKKKSKKRKHKHTKQEKEIEIIDNDSIEHGNWTKARKVEDIIGAVAIEIGKHTYVKALDNGLFTIGAPHNDYEGPAPEEILTAVVINEKKIAFKSGYGKYLRIEKNGNLTGRSDAIGAMEQWEPVFQDGKLALQSFTECFMSVNDEDVIIAVDKVAKEANFIQIRCQNVREDTSEKKLPQEEEGSLEQVEINYVKKFQKFQDKKLRLCKEDKTDLERAKKEGYFHEQLLDRRSKMKADRRLRRNKSIIQ